jgi:hypothetical protein
MTTETKKKASWKLDGSYAMYTGVQGKPAKFDLIALFPDFKNMTEAQQMVTYYGLKQKLADSIAGIGKGASDEMKIKDMTETYDRLVAGQWNKPGGSGGGVRKPTFEVFFEEAAKLELTEEQAQVMYDKLYQTK